MKDKRTKCCECRYSSEVTARGFTAITMRSNGQKAVIRKYITGQSLPIDME
jgi:hypothetical protein